jgi:MbtH protein
LSEFSAGTFAKLKLANYILPIQSKNEEIKMNQDNTEDTTIYKVVVNGEGQYSIWPAERENALGWKDAGKSGSKPECLAYIKEVWTDMRPLSLQKQMADSAD